MESFQLLLASPASLFRECLQSALWARLPEAAIRTADDMEHAYEACRQNAARLSIIDVDGLAGVSPAEVRKFGREFAHTTVIVVGRLRNDSDIVAYLEAGAADVRISDGESLDQFCDSIERALEGDIQHGPERMRAIFRRLQRLSADVSRMSLLDSMLLTDREMEILRLVDEGQSNKQIAKALHISLHTVKNHVHRILEKLQVSNRRKAVHLAYTNGWLTVNVN